VCEYVAQLDRVLLKIIRKNSRMYNIGKLFGSEAVFERFASWGTVKVRVSGK